LLAARDAHVHGKRPVASDPLELSFLQHPEQGDLGFRRQLADLIEEDRSAVSRFETPDPSLHRSGEDPFSWPNSSDAMSVGGMAAQFTRMNARLERLEFRWIARR